MSNKYKEELNKIVMNDDMKKRILQKVLAASENSEGENIKAEINLPKVKRHNNLKRNMQMVAAGFTIVLCLTVAKNYPMFLNNASNDIKQNESVKSNSDENSDLKSSSDKELVYNKDNQESLNSDQKQDETSNTNNKTYNNGDSTKKEESNISSEVGKEEKNKAKLPANSSSEVVKSQTSQNNDGNTVGDSNISAKINPEEANNKENKNVASEKSKTDSGEVKLNKIPEDNSDGSASNASVMSAEVVNSNVEYKTLDEAEKALNLKVNSLKALPKDFKMENISIISNQIIQVEYKDSNSNITFRAGKGIDNISGDYNVYEVKKSVKVSGLNINLEGNKPEEYNLAVWEEAGISYSISTENGLDEKTILNMIL